jgi:hypothetical protein
MRPASALLLVVAVSIPAVAMACGGSVGGGRNAKDSGGPEFGVILRDTAPSVDVMERMDASIADIGPVSTTYPAPHPPMPQVVSSGGPVFSSPVLVPIVFDGDVDQDEIASFTSGIAGTSYWSTIVSQYGVGAAAVAPVVVLTAGEQPAGPTLTDSELETWLANQIGSGVLEGMDAADTVFVIYFPAGWTITFPDPSAPGGTATSCVEFGGYHSNTTIYPPGTNVTYAVIPRCDPFTTTAGQTFTGVGAITDPASHEIVEAVTDPEPMTNPAYLSPDANDIIWLEFTYSSGEVMDMCEVNPGSVFEPSGFDFLVQRGWSNEAALASHDPCQPGTPGEVYFNSVAVLPSTPIHSGGTSFTTNAVSLTVGGSKTVEVDLFSDGPTAGPWTVQAMDAESRMGMGPSVLSFAWDATSGQNGQKLHLTITASSMPSSLGVPGLDGFVLESQLGSQTSYWVGAVIVQ